MQGWDITESRVQQNSSLIIALEWHLWLDNHIKCSKLSNKESRGDYVKAESGISRICPRFIISVITGGKWRICSTLQGLHTATNSSENNLSQKRRHIYEIIYSEPVCTYMLYTTYCICLTFLSIQTGFMTTVQRQNGTFPKIFMFVSNQWLY